MIWNKIAELLPDVSAHNQTSKRILLYGEGHIPAVGVFGSKSHPGGLCGFFTQKSAWSSFDKANWATHWAYIELPTE